MFMNKLFHVLHIVFFTVGITLFIFGSPVVVRADDSSFPHVVTAPLTFSAFADGARSYSLSSSDGAYYYSSYSEVYNDANARTTTWHTYNFLTYNIGSSPVVNASSTVNYFSGDFTYNFNSTDYHVYYAVYTCSFSDVDYVDPSRTDRLYNQTVSGTKVFNSFNDHNSAIALTKFFLFGVGNFDYENPVQDIEDAALDIKGLSAFILNDFQATPDYIATAKNAWKEFYLWSMNKLTGQIFDDSFVPIDLQDPITGTTKYFVPGVALSWFSPTLDNDIIYNIWIDGVSDIKYKTSSNIIDNFFNSQRLDTISYGKLKINDSSLSQNPSVYYQYNTAQAVDVILDYIQNNALATSPVQIDTYNYISLDTKISRVYIQASKVVDGNNHVGALSYVDIVGGVPVIHEGITSIDDVTASDPSTGTPAIVGSTSVVSGDTIYGGDTYFDNSTTNYITTGLVVGGGDPLSALAAVKKLFSAIFELVQALYLTKLIKWILVGFTGNPLGDLIL